MSGNGFAKGLESHLGSLQRYALLLTRNRVEADDLVQDCLTKAIASASQWRSGTDLRAWLFRILYTCHISDRRKQQVRTRYAEQATPSANVEATQLLQIETRQVLSALESLPDAQREAIMVIALEDVKYEEAARRLGVPIGTFMSRLARGREALRQRMDATRQIQGLRLVKGGRDA
jgi:RNA polymerase sigma-70 factor (ECF subfamily)